MGSQNVEIVRRMWEAFKGLDVTTIDWESEAVLAMLARQFYPRSSSPGRRPGRANVITAAETE